MTTKATAAEVVVIGQAARDLVLAVDGLPPAGGSSRVLTRIERLGGKGANQAVGLTQLGSKVALVAVLGQDSPGEMSLEDAVRSGLGIDHIIRRGTTALLVDLVERDGTRRLLEDVPPGSWLTVPDIRSAKDTIRSADTLCLQLQQPPDVLVEAAHIGLASGSRIVLDGAVEGAAGDILLSRAEVLRADVHEAELWIGSPVTDARDASAATRALLKRGPSIVALAVPEEGDLVSWSDGEHLFPFGTGNVVDPTGAGDAFFAGIVTALRQGSPPERAGEVAANAAAQTVQHLGGRPGLQSIRRD